MRTRISIFALMMTALICGEARSADLPGHEGRTGGFMEPRVGANPPGMSGCEDNIFCPVYSYFSFNSGARRQQTLREYINVSRRVPGTNPDVFAIPPLPYGPGRMRMRSTPDVKTTAPATGPVTVPATTPAGAADSVTPAPAMP